MDHDLYPLVFDEWFEWLDLQGDNVDGFLGDEVMGFNRIEPKSGKTYLTLFCEKAAARGFFVRVATMLPSLWVTMTRDRFHHQGKYKTEAPMEMLIEESRNMP